MGETPKSRISSGNVIQVYRFRVIREGADDSYHELPDNKIFRSPSSSQALSLCKRVRPTLTRPLLSEGHANRPDAIAATSPVSQSGACQTWSDGMACQDAAAHATAGSAFVWKDPHDFAAVMRMGCA